MAYYGVTAKNEGQRVAVRALLNDKPLLFLTGPAGTGKTLITEAVGLHRLTEAQDFRKMMYTRMQTQIGVDLGALPGSVDEKTYPFMRPFLDNLDAMAPEAKRAYHYLTTGGEDKRKLFFDAIQTMRGGSFLHMFVMTDEAQNLDTHTISTVATRPADGTKIVFLGNFAQIDDHRLRTPETNGLYRLLAGLYEAGAFEYFDHVNLTEVMRHPVVDVVERILRNHDMPAEFATLEARGNIA
ncbi:PhoH-like protein [Paenibacillus sp. BK033]|uniref:PhoH family protein n=1 Tax=Paenibacillus sp. BK033 TaxID=2512133 RepID=UPI001052DBE3|nr:PhoH family protein [Paenibacillus sp. BK033]TCM89631.1 PhoH-like protein [Paenibacillus sp. BK033]